MRSHSEHLVWAVGEASKGYLVGMVKVQEALAAAGVAEDPAMHQIGGRPRVTRAPVRVTIMTPAAAVAADSPTMMRMNPCPRSW